MTKARSEARTGADGDALLKEAAMHADVQDVVLLRVLAWKIREAMKASAITKAEMARRLNTTRSQIESLLDPTTDHIELALLSRAANAIDCGPGLNLAD